jgi:iron complex outermembrane receptor protein
VFLGTTLLADTVRGQEAESPLEAPAVTVVAPPEEDQVEDRTASVEVIDVDELTPGTSLADALNEVAGLRLRRLGGLEAYSAASIRGSSANQVIVLQDGVPLGSASGPEVNLSELPLDQYQEIQVYRGPSAAHFGSGAMGGVINLITRTPEGTATTRTEAGVGSLLPGQWNPRRILSASALRRVTLRTRGQLANTKLLALGSFMNTEGDFTYYNDNGTRLDQSDDSYSRRKNNDATQWDMLLRGDTSLNSRLRVDWGQNASARSQGIPGYTHGEGTTTRFRTLKSMTFAELDQRTGSSWFPRIKARVSVRLRRDEWEDPHGDVGLSNDHDDDLVVDLAGQLRAAARLPFTNGTGWLQTDVRHETFSHRTRLIDEDTWGWQRTTWALGSWLTWALAGGKIEVAPQARFEVVHDSPMAGGPPVHGGRSDFEAQTRTFASEQVGVLYRPTSWLMLRSATGLTQRAPTFLELFGDRGTIVSNPELEPETGWTADGSVAFRARPWKRLTQAKAEVTGFYRRATNLIQMAPNSQKTFHWVNIGAARVAGIEAAGGLTLDWASGTGSPWPGFLVFRGAFTFMDAKDISGTYSDGWTLPFRPRWELFGRAEWSFGPFQLAYEVDYVGRNYLDAANHYFAPHRLFHSAEFQVDLRSRRGPTVTLQARNLANTISRVIPVQAEPQDLMIRTPVADVLGFPLPGITVFLNLRWDMASL